MQHLSLKVLDKSSIYFCSPVPSILLKSSLERIHRRLAGFDFRKLLMWELNQQTVFPHFQRWGSYRLTCTRASPASHPHREESLSNISFNLPSVSLNTLNICHVLACFAAVTKKQSDTAGYRDPLSCLHQSGYLLVEIIKIWCFQLNVLDI